MNRKLFSVVLTNYSTRWYNHLLILFHKPETGALKENFVFILDNGPSEQPSSSMVQMCLARLCKFLNLDRATQFSLVEYNSKRNFVERVHPRCTVHFQANFQFQFTLMKGRLENQSTLKTWKRWRRMLLIV